MNIFKAFLKIPELFFTFLWWAFIYIIYFSFRWFFNEPINYLTFLMPICFLFSVYLGYFVSGKHKNLNPIVFLDKKINLLLLSIIGFLPVCMLFFTRAKLSKNISTIRQESLEGSTQATIWDTMYSFLFPLVIVAFILVNFNNLKQKWVVNIVTLASIIAFIPINGGRGNLVVFGCLYTSIFFYKNYKKILSSFFSSLLKYLSFFIVGSIIMASYTIFRIGADGANIINSYTNYQYVNADAVHSLTRLPGGIGFALVLFIFTFYDYTGGCVYYLDIFMNKYEDIKTMMYGGYNFKFLNRGGGDQEWMQVHDKVDALYLKYDVTYNVWATSIRDLFVDFGLIGVFVFVFVISYLMFYAKKYITTSYTAQVIYFMSMAFFMFSPFHSIFYQSRPLGVCFVFIVLFFIVKTKKNATKIT